ncbi:MAG: MMPL family transporter [Actinomycetota bacterium]
MFTRLGHLTVRRRKLILFSSALMIVVAAVIGTGVFGQLADGGFDDPNSESSRGDDFLATEFDTGEANLILVVEAASGDVNNAAVVAAGTEVEAELAATDGVTDVVSYWSLGQPDTLASTDGATALILGRAVGDETQQEEIAVEVIDEFTFDGEVIDVGVAGQNAIFNAIGTTIENDLVTAELIAIPLTLLLLIFVFRGVIAALMPIAVGISSILGAFFVLFLVTLVTDVSIFSINLITALGLGLSIDYSLLIVSRYREELAKGGSVEGAVVRTVETAGRTVAFSAMTVAVSLAALLLFPLYFLRSFAYGGIGVLIVAMFASIVALPALLAVLGHRVNSWSFGKGRTSSESPTWGRVGRAVMRRPGIVAVSVIALLLFVGSPFLNVNFGTADERVLPANDPTRQLVETLDEEFASDEASAFPIVAPEMSGPADVEAYAIAVSNVDDITRVDTATGSYADGVLVAEASPSSSGFSNGTDTWFSVVPGFEAISPLGEDRIAEIREIPAPTDTLVTGETASLVDSKASIFGLVPFAGLWIAGATFVLLFLMFGSFLVPLKAIVLNLLSLTATFGAMVWIFQEGNGAGLLDFTATGLTDTSMPILMFCVAFGLSMDYEVFLLSRIKEEYDRTGDNEHAVVTGLAKTGGIITAAALVLSITFFAFATSDITFITLFGFGLGVAILVDAFIVRSTLVPALMKLAGEWNWWAPAWARRVHDRFGISEAAPPGDQPDHEHDDVDRPADERTPELV